MRLASIQLPETRSEEDRRDGRLIVVSQDGRNGLLVEHETCRTMRRAVDNWSEARPLLERAAASGEGISVDLSEVSLKAPLPRAADFVDGSGYLSHIARVRRARNAELPPDLKTNPLMYRGIPNFLDPIGDVAIARFIDGVDCEGEIAVIVGDVPAGASHTEALDRVLLVTQINDVSLRELAKAELTKQFGFLGSKPPSVAGPFAVTPDELGAAWNEGRPQLRMRVERNGQVIGDLDTSELHFSVGELIAHAAKTHPLGVGTVVGTGTISNRDERQGVACIAEQVALDTLAGRQSTPYFRDGETVAIETTLNGRSLFGRLINRFVSRRG